MIVDDARALGAATMTAATQLGWDFSQVFGERAPGEEVQDADIISAVEFDADGEKLATGDRGGRVVLFERIHQSKSAVEELRSRFDESGMACDADDAVRALT